MLEIAVVALNRVGPNLLLELWDLVHEHPIQRLGLLWLSASKQDTSVGVHTKKGGKLKGSAQNIPSAIRGLRWYRQALHPTWLGDLSRTIRPGRFRFVCCRECRDKIKVGVTPKFSPLRHYLATVPPMVRRAWLDAESKKNPPGQPLLGATLTMLTSRGGQASSSDGANTTSGVDDSSENKAAESQRDYERSQSEVDGLVGTDSVSDSEDGAADIDTSCVRGWNRVSNRDRRAPRRWADRGSGRCE